MKSPARPHEIGGEQFSAGLGVHPAPTTSSRAAGTGEVSDSPGLTGTSCCANFPDGLRGERSGKSVWFGRSDGRSRGGTSLNRQQTLPSEARRKSREGRGARAQRGWSRVPSSLSPEGRPRGATCDTGAKGTCDRTPCGGATAARRDIALRYPWRKRDNSRPLSARDPEAASSDEVHGTAMRLGLAGVETAPEIEVMSSLIRGLKPTSLLEACSPNYAPIMYTPERHDGEHNARQLHGSRNLTRTMYVHYLTFWWLHAVVPMACPGMSEQPMTFDMANHGTNAMARPTVCNGKPNGNQQTPRHTMARLTSRYGNPHRSLDRKS